MVYFHYVCWKTTLSLVRSNFKLNRQAYVGKSHLFYLPRSTSKKPLEFRVLGRSDDFKGVLGARGCGPARLGAPCLHGHAHFCQPTHLGPMTGQTSCFCWKSPQLESQTLKITRARPGNPASFLYKPSHQSFIYTPRQSILTLRLQLALDELRVWFGWFFALGLEVRMKPCNVNRFHSVKLQSKFRFKHGLLSCVTEG